MSINYYETMNNDIFLKKLGRKIKILREDKNIPQDQFANELDIDQSYLSKIENGKANPSIIYLKQIADALDVDIIELFNFVI